VKRPAFESMLADALGGQRNALSPDPERASVGAWIDAARGCAELARAGRDPVLPAEVQDVPPCF
jgi:hypothetical protein